MQCIAVDCIQSTLNLQFRRKIEQSKLFFENTEKEYTTYMYYIPESGHNQLLSSLFWVTWQVDKES